jgi:hypothetical protein
MAFVAGQDLTAAQLNSAVGGTWATWTPTWTGAVSNPAVGNATVSAGYTKVGKTIHYRITILMGTTTTYGSGRWAFALPEAAASYPGATGLTLWAGMAYALDAGTSNNIGATRVDSGATTLFLTNATFDWDATHPFTWTTSDLLVMNGTYEAATF